jgi:dTMP kinase
LNIDELWRAGRLSTGGLEPDLTVVLDLPITTAAERRAHNQADRLERRDPAYHERVRRGFLAEAMRWPDRIAVIDATLSVELVQEEIRGRIQTVLPTKRA